MSERNSGIPDLAGRIADWWRKRGEIAAFGKDDIERMAQDIGLSAEELTGLAAQGSDTAALLRERMAALGVTPADADRVALGLMRNLERECACCCSKEACADDLANRPADPAWKGYCPNANSLESAARMRGRALI